VSPPGYAADSAREPSGSQSVGRRLTSPGTLVGRSQWSTAAVVPVSAASETATLIPSVSFPRSRWLLFGGLAVLALALRLACATGLVGSDDLYYSKFARALSEGHYTSTVEEVRKSDHIHHALRYGVLIPVAVVYKAFGVTEWTTILVPLLASTLCVVLLALIGESMFSVRVGIIAALLYATFPIQLHFASVLEPEPISECFALLGVLTYLHARRTERATLWFAAGFLMGTAYLAKEAALFIGGAFFLHAAWERRWKGALIVALGMASVIAIELTYYSLVWGDILFRPHSTRLYKLVNTESFFVPTPGLAYRLLGKYPKAMVVPDVRFGLHSLACLLCAAAALTLKPRRGYMMIALWAAIPWLYLNFGSWSLTRYAPLPTAPRYIEFTYPPLMLLTGIVVSRAFSARPMIARFAMAALAVVLSVGVACGLSLRGTIAWAEEMTVLREIVRAADAVPGQQIYTPVVRWRYALDVFDASIVSETAETATVVLTRDALGLPAVQPGPRAPNGLDGPR
jgi:hypothetical protein